MKKFLFITVALIFSVGFFQSCNDPLVNEPIGNEPSLKSADGKVSYIVVLKDAELATELSKQKDYDAKQKISKSSAEKILKRAGITDGELGFVYGSALQGFSVKVAPGQLKKLQDDPSVDYIEEDQVVTLIIPDVKINAKPGGGGSTPQKIPWGIARVGGPGEGTVKTAWIIDTGIDLDHPELYVDVKLSKTFVNSFTADDDNGHGSHVAGIIAARNNGFGVVGVAPGAKLVAVKVLSRSGSGSNAGVIAGVDYVGATAASGDVANMSLGGGVSQALDDAVLRASTYNLKNIYFTLAAGNESDDANNHSPARVNGTNIFTISACDVNNKWASWSNFGNPPVDYCEPGVNIYSCYKGGGYATMSGTSMAAPHMAGLLLLGPVRTDGKVSNDPDGNADPIGVH